MGRKNKKIYVPTVIWEDAERLPKQNSASGRNAWALSFCTRHPGAEIQKMLEVDFSISFYFTRSVHFCENEPKKRKSVSNVLSATNRKRRSAKSHDVA